MIFGNSGRPHLSSSRCTQTQGAKETAPAGGGRMTCFPALDAQKSPKLSGRDCSRDSALLERIHLPPLDTPSVELRAIMNNPDQDTLIRAIEDARRILGEYIEPGPRDASRTVEHLLAVLDRTTSCSPLTE
jgi:hypothetical protein